MALDFQCRPSSFFGLHLHEEHAWLAYSVDRAVWTFGSFIRNRQEETVEKDAPSTKAKKPKIREPKYTAKQIRAMIYDPIPDAEATKRSTEGASMPYLNIDPYDVEADDASTFGPNDDA